MPLPFLHDLLQFYVFSQFWNGEFQLRYQGVKIEIKLELIFNTKIEYLSTKKLSDNQLDLYNVITFFYYL
jgi:hypothetical protein